MFRVVLTDNGDRVFRELEQLIPWRNYGCERIQALEISDNVPERPPDIIFAGISNGLESVVALRERFPDAQVAVLTDCRDFDTVREAMRLDVVRYLLLPIDAAEITEALETMTEHLRKNEKFPPETEAQNPFGSTAEIESFVVRHALDYIGKYYNGKVTLQSVADHVYVSRWHLSRLLKKHTGENYVDILQRVRIEKAKEYLKDPSLQINMVAGMVGFTDVTRFSEVFKKVTGSTAGKYRDKDG